VLSSGVPAPLSEPPPFLSGAQFNVALHIATVRKVHIRLLKYHHLPPDARVLSSGVPAPL